MEVDKPIATAVMFFLILIWSVYLLSPKYQEFQEVLAQVGLEQANLDSRQAYFVEITKVYRELLQYQDALDKIDAALPTKMSIAQALNLVYQKGSESGVTINKIDITRSATSITNSKIRETVFSLNLLGSYDSLKNFLSALEKSARLVENKKLFFVINLPDLKAIQKSGSGTAKAPEIFTTKLDMTVYSY